MKLFCDARIITVPHPHGLSRYCIGIISALHEIAPITVLISDKRQLEHLPHDINYLLVGRFGVFSQLQVTHLLNKLEVDVLYSPTQFLALGKRRFRVAMTLHDTIGIDVKGQLSSDIPLLLRMLWKLFHLTPYPQKMILAHADLILTVSYDAQNAILRNGLTKKKPEVIYNAPFMTKTNPRAKIVRKQLLYNGSFFTYKNVEFLVRAMRLLPEFELILMSKVGSSVKRQLIDIAQHPKQLVFLNGIDDQAYLEQLAHVQALVSPSLKEGFGLPIIEAQMASTPVVVSDIPIFHEICHDNSALFFSPNDIEDFAKQIRLLAASPKLEQSLVKAGSQNSRRFSWHESATKLYNLLQTIDRQTH